MTIESSSPILIVAITNNAGNPQFQTNVPHGMLGGTIGTIAGCRNASGALMGTYNGASVVTVVDAYNFTTSTAYVAGYASGGGVWPTGAEVSSGELTGFDSKLALRVTDKTGDTLVGPVTLSGTPGVAVSDPAAQIVTNNPTSQIVTMGAGVKYNLGDGDDVDLYPPRTQSIFVSMTEALNEYGSDGIQFGQQLTNSMFVLSTNNGSTSIVQKFWLPLSRLRDKATLLRATLFFFPSPYNAGLPPTVAPTLQLFRFNPVTDIALTSLAANGPATFPLPSAATSYGATPPVPSSGYFNPTFLTIGETVQLTAGQLLSDSSGNLFKVSLSGNYTASTPVPIVAVAPSTGTFYATNGNLAGGTPLTWSSTPSGLGPTGTVAAAGLSGGLNGFYAQKLIFTPDASMSTIDQSTYAYVAKVTDDDVNYANGGTAINTAYSGILLDFGNIVSLTPT